MNLSPLSLCGHLFEWIFFTVVRDQIQPILIWTWEKNLQRGYDKIPIRNVILTFSACLLSDSCETYSTQPMEPILHQATPEVHWATERNLNIWVSDLWTLGFDQLGVYLFSWPLTLACWPLVCRIYHLCSFEMWPGSEMGALLPWHAIT